MQHFTSGKNRGPGSGTHITQSPQVASGSAGSAAPRASSAQRAIRGVLSIVHVCSGEALRFAISAPGASFSLPVWVLAADAGPMIVDVAFIHHPGGPAVDVTVDGAVVATVATVGPAWAITPHALSVTLAPGRHRVGFRLPTARAGQVLAIDYVELRPRR